MLRVVTAGCPVAKVPFPLLVLCYVPLAIPTSLHEATPLTEPPCGPIRMPPWERIRVADAWRWERACPEAALAWHQECLVALAGEVKKADGD